MNITTINWKFEISNQIYSIHYKYIPLWRVNEKAATVAGVAAAATAAIKYTIWIAVKQRNIRNSLPLLFVLKDKISEEEKKGKVNKKKHTAKMSTSTLGGFEREERKILYDEYLFQRRVLFGITISIVFAAFVWTIAICTDHWIVVDADERMYLYWSCNIFIHFLAHLKSSICDCHLEKWIRLGRWKSLERCVLKPLCMHSLCSPQQDHLLYWNIMKIEIKLRQRHLMEQQQSKCIATSVTLSHPLCTQVCRIFQREQKPKRRERKTEAFAR